MTTQLTNKLHYTKNSRHYIHKIVRSKRERVNRAHWYMNSEAKTIMVLKQILDTLARKKCPVEKRKRENCFGTQINLGSNMFPFIPRLTTEKLP